MVNLFDSMEDSDLNNFIYDYDFDENDSHFVEYQSLYSSCTNCVLPVLEKAVINIISLYIWALIYRILHDRISKWCSHILCSLCGLGSLVTNNGINGALSHLLILGITSFIILKLCKNWPKKGALMSFYCLSYLLICEFINGENWREVSGTQMILVMKIISISFDKTEFSTVEYFGYIYSVSNIIFGPWIPFKEYLKLNVELNAQTIRLVSKHLLIGLVCLIVSSCIGYWLIPDDANSTWNWLLVVYRNAFLFRTSHYFVCHLSGSISMLAGFYYSDVVDIAKVEMPKSLVQVVVHWNIPMHKWLKYYIFKPSQQYFNNTLISIICVYVASAALHGFSSALSLVLLSLGIYTYVEYTLRYKLNTILKPYSPYYQYSTDFLFTVMAIIHLAYLGVIFEEINLSKVSNPFQHTMQTWSQLYFFSHFIIILQYLLYLLI